MLKQVVRPLHHASRGPPPPRFASAGEDKAAAHFLPHEVGEGDRPKGGGGGAPGQARLVNLKRLP
jgi:hypothetical protein